MVSSLSVFFMYVTVFLAIVVPIVLIIYLWIKTRYDLIAVAFGGIGFYFAQVMVKLGILSSLAQSNWFVAMSKYHIIMGIFMGVFAGVLAEFTRILVLIFLIKKEDRNWKNAIGYGVGYGGIESIMGVGMAFLSFVGYAFAINSGYFDTLIGVKFTAAQALQIKADLMQPAYFYLLAGIERTALLVFQIALSILVMYGVAEGKPAYFGYAFLAHVVLNVPLVLLSQLHRIVGVLWLIAVGVYAFKFILKAKNDMFKKPEGPIPL